jgi:hypothetical protein
MTEQEYVEHLHHLQHATGLLELREKTNNTMRRAVNWMDPNTWLVFMHVWSTVLDSTSPR